MEHKAGSLWEVELADENKFSHSFLDKKVLEFWDENITFKDGHYYLPIPFKNKLHSFPNNKMLAEKRLSSLNSKLKIRNLTDKYEQNIQVLLDKGYAEPVTPHEIDLNDGNVWYLPHHPVLSDKKPGKIRTVFDCAAQYKGVSLNNQCLQGPDINNKLIDVLLRFRQYEYAVMADVECMYMQVKIPPSDRNVLRFLWDVNGVTQHYRMTSHLFGGVWCAASSTYALRRSTVDFPCSPAVRHAICECMYVDDLLKSCESPEEAVSLSLECAAVLKCAGFNLTKFVSNCSGVIESLPESHIAECAKSISSHVEGTALGIKWDVLRDVFSYVYSKDTSHAVINKRDMLSQLSSLYDPLGLISPIVLKGKIIFQEASRLKLDWDAEIPSRLKKNWEEWLRSLKELPLLLFSRRVCPNTLVDPVAELHLFSDGSQVGYAAVAYIRFVDRNGNVHVELLTSKSRLAPIKQLTIPRLELCAAVLAVNLNVKIRQALDFKLLPTTFWTDSEIVLGYINNESKRFKVFVGNRVAAIRQSSEPHQWKYVRSRDNAADLASRGCQVDSMPLTWTSGPPFLSLHKSAWPCSKFVEATALESDPEVICQSVTCAEVSANVSKDHPLDKLINHFSSFYRLKRVLVRLCRIKNIFRKDKTHSKISDPITANDLLKAEGELVMHAQSKCYSAEL